MSKYMTIAQFRDLIHCQSYARMGLEKYCSYLRHDKYLREEHLPLLAIVQYKLYQDTDRIELGNGTKPWDARIGDRDLYEVVQALPRDEHKVRLEIASGGQSPFTYLAHTTDHYQFPGVIVKMIEKKHDMHYADFRSLVVVFGGDYSGENDKVIQSWVKNVRRQTTRGAFKEILLVESNRFKVFPLFTTDG